MNDWRNPAMRENHKLVFVTDEEERFHEVVWENAIRKGGKRQKQYQRRKENYE
jgi:hypothetical protein